MGAVVCRSRIHVPDKLAETAFWLSQGTVLIVLCLFVFKFHPYFPSDYIALEEEAVQFKLKAGLACDVFVRGGSLLCQQN